MPHYPLALLLPDIRSARNVGAIWRTADAMGVERLITAGYTPHPAVAQDARPPHIIRSNTNAITKTALGAESTVPHEHFSSPLEAIARLHAYGYTVVALEQAESSVPLPHYVPTGPTALVVGNEVDGLSADLQAACDATLELPMLGQKESLNVAVAAGIALYQLRY